MEGEPREESRVSAALVSRSPKTTEAPALWRKRTVDAPMPFAPPDGRRVSYENVP